jgi:3-methyladenine DNA glycosylase AlkD
MRQPTPASVSTALRKLARPAGTFDAARYFRGDPGLSFYNVGTASVRALARAIYAANRHDWTVDDAMQLADLLIRDPYLETKAVGIEVLARYRRSFPPRLLTAWKRWLAANHAANWATTDHICGMLIGPLLQDQPHLIPILRTWAAHRNLWVRRASAVGVIPPVRRGEGHAVAYGIAGALHGDQKDLIQKAVGWLLRELGKQDSARLERYLVAAGTAIPRTTLRYAIERFPAAKRRALLVSTRRPKRGAESR